MVFAQLCEYTKNQWIVPFKWVSYMVCKFSLSKAFSFKNKFLKKKINKKNKNKFLFLQYSNSVI